MKIKQIAKDELQQHFTELVRELNDKYSFLKEDGLVFLTEEEKKYINEEGYIARSTFRDIMEKSQECWIDPFLVNSLDKLIVVTGLYSLANKLEMEGNYNKALLIYLKSLLIAGDEFYHNYFSIAEIFDKIKEKQKSLICYNLYLKKAGEHLGELKELDDPKNTDIIESINQKSKEAKKRIKESSL